MWCNLTCEQQQQSENWSQFCSETACQCGDTNNLANNSNCKAHSESDTVKLWTVGVFGALVSTLTVFGNLMVIVAVLRERTLRNATNLYVFSLAVADLIMGLLVMPFSIVNDTMQWPLDQDACDLWRATDVFLSTASIMHLCVIAVERYSAITNPIGHYVSRTKLAVSIVSVWLVSLCISYPAIIWWRVSRGSEPVPSGVCPFTEDAAYLVFSSLVSFYVPSAVMVFVYVKILRTAQRLTAGLRTGQLQVTLPQSMSKRTLQSDGETANERVSVTVRVHTGCRPGACGGGSPGLWRALPAKRARPSSCALALNTGRVGLGDGAVHVTVLGEEEDEQQVLASSSVRTPCEENKPVANGNGQASGRLETLSSSCTRREQQKRKIQHEQKAAKTIAFIICLFIISWTPFFLCNLVAAFSPSSIVSPEITFVVVSWLGYTNSCMNFIIYSYSLTDFRMAFKKLFGFHAKKPKRSYIPSRWQLTDSVARHKGVEYSSYYHSNVGAPDER